jgi:hypothetical protein
MTTPKPLKTTARRRRMTARGIRPLRMGFMRVASIVFALRSK